MHAESLLSDGSQISSTVWFSALHAKRNGPTCYWKCVCVQARSEANKSSKSW